MTYFAFRAGWRRGMIAISERDNNEDFKQSIRKHNTREYYDGFCAALNHFDGFNTNHIELAAVLGLIEAYSDFHGQSTYPHPTELPGHEVY